MKMKRGKGRERVMRMWQRKIRWCGRAACGDRGAEKTARLGKMKLMGLCKWRRWKREGCRQGGAGGGEPFGIISFIRNTCVQLASPLIIWIPLWEGGPERGRSQTCTLHENMADMSVQTTLNQQLLYTLQLIVWVSDCFNGIKPRFFLTGVD